MMDQYPKQHGRMVRFALPGAALLLLLSGCGGGSSDSASTTTPGTGTTNPPVVSPVWQAGVYAPEEQLVAQCAAPRSGIDPYSQQPYPDKAGTSLHEKLWLRSWSQRTYLWYRELPDRDPAGYSVADYFNLLRTTALTDSGAAKDNFHFFESTASYKQRTQGGVEAGYGIEWSIVDGRPPRKIYIAYTEPGSPAAQQGLSRGAMLLEVNAVDVVNDNTEAGVAQINAALYPAQLGQSSQMTFLKADGSRVNLSMQSAQVAATPVQNVKVIQSPAGKVGYLQFNSHIALAQPLLIDAFNLFREQGVQELVLDIRYNGGGLLALASQLGYMVAGPNVIQNRIFEKTMFNDKYPNTDPVTGRALQPMPFYNRAIDYQNSQFTNQTLPNLTLKRVFVLTTDSTCSASEALMNALRGVDLEVIQIGNKTCGKPYGFYPTDNCGTTYFSIQFSGVNAKNFGEFADGFNPTPAPQFAADVKGCVVKDDFTAQLGDSKEKLLSAALNYMTSQSCPAPALSAADNSKTEALRQQKGLSVLMKDPRQQAILLENKLQQPLLPEQL
ncbi:S41 family peptidase [Rheinheimera sp.]|uniref:S41 family peptidase n=1 Tax=Rheinheimera sp. TaxID=1869214 RepID=UPI0027B8B262|nr:S41 family peptidase [Rheinheimera sp.]